MARPTKYQEAYAEQARKLCLLGYTDAELADFFEVSESTINKWKLDYPKFSETIKKGKAVADAEVSDRLYQRAMGFVAPDIDTLRKYQQANAVYADEAAKLKNTRLKNVLMKGDLTPEVVNNMLFSKNKSEIKTLYNSVGRVGRAQMRNGIIGKAMEKSGGSPDQFLRQLNILQNQTGITFKGQDAAYLKGLKKYLQSTQQAAKAAVTTPTGQQTIPFIIGYGTATNPATTGAAVSYGLLTRAYESEPFRNAML